MVSLPLRNARHEIFAQEVAKGASTEAAFVAAGFKANSGNARRLKMVEAVRSRIEAILSERVAADTKATNKAIEKLALSKEWVLSRLMENVERAMQAKPSLDSDGEPTGEFKYEGNVANKGLELLGRHIGLFIEQGDDAPMGQPVDRPPRETREQWISRRTRQLAPHSNGHANGNGVVAAAGATERSH